MDAARWYELGLTKMDEGNYIEAKDLFLNTIQFDPGNLKAHENLALCYVHQGEFEQALTIYDKLVALDGDSPVKLQHAALLLMMERPSDAESKFKIILEEDPLNEAALKGLGDSYFRQLNYKDSLIIYSQLIEKHPNDAFLWFSKAEALYRSQDHEKALEAIEMAIKIEQAPEFFAFKGDFFIRHDSYERALEQYRLAANLDPDNPEIQMRLGFIFRILERQKDALNAFEKAYSLDNNYLEALKGKIEILEVMNQPDTARAVKEKLIRTHPQDLKFALTLIHEYMENQGFERAVELLEILTDVHSDNIEVWYGLTYSLIQLNEFKRAKQALNKLITLDGNQKEYQDMSAVIEDGFGSKL